MCDTQTCRGLHAFGCTDYVWHQIAVDLPLDLPPRCDVKSLPGSHLQRVIMKAMQLERNWLRKSSSIRHCRQIPLTPGDVMHQMQILRPRWLVGLSRSQSVSQISVWGLGDMEGDNRLLASLKIRQSAVKFSATLQTESKAVIAVIESDGSEIE